MTLLILIVLSFVFVVSQVNMLYYQLNGYIYTPVYNETLNSTVIISRPITDCVQLNTDIVLAQDMIFVLMRIILPFIIMLVCTSILFNYARVSRKALIRRRQFRKEHTFTLVVTITNVWFLICNIGVVVYYFMFYYYKFSGASLPIIAHYTNLLFGACAIVLSYSFTFSWFFIDMLFNRTFRKEILLAVLFLTSLRDKIMTRVTQNNNTQNSNTQNNIQNTNL